MTLVAFVHSEAVPGTFRITRFIATDIMVPERSEGGRAACDEHDMVLRPSKTCLVSISFQLKDSTIQGELDNG